LEPYISLMNLTDDEKLELVKPTETHNP
jgi:hypothetical protein